MQGPFVSDFVLTSWHLNEHNQEATRKHPARQNSARAALNPTDWSQVQSREVLVLQSYRASRTNQSEPSAAVARKGRGVRNPRLALRKQDSRIVLMTTQSLRQQHPNLSATDLCDSGRKGRFVIQSVHGYGVMQVVLDAGSLKLAGQSLAVSMIA